jgi:large conductance mechanosensitive channel
MANTTFVKTWVDEFKTFLLRGNVVDTAVGLIIGLAFAAVISSLVADLLTPLIAAIFGKPDFASLSFTINSSVFHYGSFLNALISFVLVALTLFLVVVKPVNAMRARRENPDPTMQNCPHCLSEIPLDAHRCAFCTSELSAAA